MPSIRVAVVALSPLLMAACASAPSIAPAPLDDPPVAEWLQVRAAALAGGEAIAVEVIDAPQVQAEFSPDGRLRIWRGLLLRTRGEAEVTFVLAHELAHRSLGHFARRATGAGWDPLEAEREADRAALEALRQMGLRADAATALLSLVAGESALDPEVDRAALAVVEQRLEVLWAQTAGGDVHPTRERDAWRALMDARFEAWLAADPAGRDPDRTALLREHLRRPGQRASGRVSTPPSPRCAVATRRTPQAVVVPRSRRPALARARTLASLLEGIVRPASRVARRARATHRARRRAPCWRTAQPPARGRRLV